ncbi:hypothetical protein D3C87_2120930 [compost metagenome]
MGDFDLGDDARTACCNQRFMHLAHNLKQLGDVALHRGLQRVHLMFYTGFLNHFDRFVHVRNRILVVRSFGNYLNA